MVKGGVGVVALLGTFLMSDSYIPLQFTISEVTTV